ncbi:MAG: UDP-N-acetylmuramoyl-L-alanyl-D-glutamate--2,6-diaminopimelate ligase [Candidatus Omnitrophota bacterium]|nr:UDP-N-acetylmuramoyl-L-alanyl-D-glutamate--2,6-diaminopimelate ligase [Candidatus Omnitrophota bacterium]
MKLDRILEGVEFKPGSGTSDVEVDGLTCSSSGVRSGDMFVAFRGYTQNGYKYISEAIANGAAVILAEEDFNAGSSVKKIVVKDTRIAIPIIAANYYGHPSERLKVIGVTGTNGKTTITYIIENILKAAGEGAGVIGTINYRLKGKVLPAKNTTPGSLELQSMLAEMVRDGLRYAVMEVSSHSLDQRRVEGVSFDAAIFTNITSEHLDYHKTLEEYFKAKTKIFDRLKEDGFAILNKDDLRVASLRSSIKRKVISYGIKEDALIMAEDIKLSLEGSGFVITTPEGALKINAKLIGMHNVSNILAAVAAAFALNIDLEAIKNGVEALTSVPGRLEPIDARQPYKIFVDYAHTEDALNKILILLKGVAKNKIITVFGCGGDRDKTKRPLMGRAACKFSDHVIITSDNPRFEDPVEIIGQIEDGVKWGYSNYDIVPDRGDALKKALDIASKGDIVVIAGKGHENYQIIKDKVLPFNDREVVLDILRKKGYAGKRDIKDYTREVVVG